jgi:hypothetical protein
LRFAVHRPGNPEASQRCHGVPRRDVPSRVHVSVARVSTGCAPEGGLVLARLPIHVPARATPLAGERGTDLLHPARRLVFQAAYQQAPAGSQDLPIQPGLSAGVPARILESAPSRACHVPYLEVFNSNHVEPTSASVARLPYSIHTGRGHNDRAASPPVWAWGAADTVTYEHTSECYRHFQRGGAVFPGRGGQAPTPRSL